VDDWIEAVLRQGQPPRRRAWSITILLVAMAFLVCLLLHPAHPHPFLLFIPAIFLAAVLFDRGSSFVATGMSVLLSMYHMEPYGRFTWPDPGQGLELLTFVLVGSAIGLLTERLRNALVENARLRGQSELLLKELNHRIRNDLSQVQGLLQLEQRREPTSGLQTAIARIAVLGQLYSHLTPKEGHAAVEMTAFLEGLVNGLRDAQQGSRPIGLRLMTEPMQLPLALATPLGLITNELVTNAFKYAFPNERPGRIDVALRHTAGGVELTVADDGVGHDPTAPATGGGLGRMLVEQLVRQLGGLVAIEGHGSTRVVVRFSIAA
jgi:two-component sensor histidine kinase